MPAHPILITGATGKTGRRVARILENRGTNVRRASRSAQIPFDWTDESTWAAALDGVCTAYVVLPELGSTDGIDQAGAFAEQAAAARVRKVVLLSVPLRGGVDADTITTTEGHFTDAGLVLTVVRPHWFSQNFSEDFLHDPVMTGDLRLPAGQGRDPIIDADDIAEVAVAALTDSQHDGKSYELTGPRALSFGEMADELTRATGRTITYTPLSTEEYVDEQLNLGMPAEFAELLANTYAAIATGTLAEPTSDVETVLGKPPRDFADFATANAAAGVWDTKK